MRQVAERVLVIGDFVLVDPPRGAARDDRGQQAGEPAFMRRLVLGLDRLQVIGDLSGTDLARIEREELGDLEPNVLGLWQASAAVFAAGHLTLVGRHGVEAGLVVAFVITFGVWIVRTY